MTKGIHAEADRRPLGTMIAYGFVEEGHRVDLKIARRLGATIVEVLPAWRSYPDPVALRAEAEADGFKVSSVHACWGSQSIKAARVDLGSPDPRTSAESLDDLRRCVDWIAEAGGRFLVVHPGGLSNPADGMARRAALVQGLNRLADHAEPAQVVLCVENMPPGVHPGSRMSDLAGIVAEIQRPEHVGLALDTGHAHISHSPEAETRAAGRFLRTTHVHDNDGRQDAHLPPGLGSLDWPSWARALDAIGYRGPVMLECIRHLRNHPELLDESFLKRLHRLTTPFDSLEGAAPE